MTRATRFLAALALFLAAGCGGSPFAVSPVEGDVKLDGTALVGVSVQFLPDPSLKNAPGSSAITDANGHFVLRTSDGRPGAVVGKHTVLIRTERADERSGKAGSARAVPAPYTQAGTTNPLGTIEVTGDKKTGYDFDLKSS